MTNDKFLRFFFLRISQWIGNSCEPTAFRGKVLPFRKDTGLCGNLMELMYQHKLPVDRRKAVSQLLTQSFSAAKLSTVQPFNREIDDNRRQKYSPWPSYLTECMGETVYQNPRRLAWIKLWSKP